MTTEELRESLLAAPQNGYTKLTAEQRAEMESYCKRYAAFMDACKTEREATAWAVAIAEEHGFKALVPGMKLQPGDKVYKNNRDKSIMLAVIGSASLNEGSNICAAHVSHRQRGQPAAHPGAGPCRHRCHCPGGKRTRPAV